MSEMWRSPSTPGSSSTNAPKSVRLHLALDPLARLVAFLDGRPRVGLDLLHAERDALGGLVHVEHHHVHHVADVDEL
jgi:hypothetical protein